MKEISDIILRVDEIKGLYTGKGIQFAFSSSLKDGGKQVTTFCSCREGFTREIYDFFDPCCVCGPKEIDTGNISALILSKDCYNRKYMDEWMKTSLKLLNHHEDLVGWSKTKLFNIKHDIGNKIFVYLFVGNKKWMMSVHMISLFTLLIRMGIQPELREFETHKEYLKTCYRMCRKDKKYVDRDRFDTGDIGADVKKFSSVYGKIRIIMKNFNHIFKGRTMEECYKYLGNGAAYSEGINILCESRGRAGDDVIGERFAKLCKKYDI